MDGSGGLCKDHAGLHAVPDKECVIIKSEDKFRMDPSTGEHTMAMRYLMSSGEWVDASRELLPQVRAFERRTAKQRLCSSYARPKGSFCGTDQRKEVSEITVQSQSSGILTAVCTCHFVFAIQMLYSSESCTQVAMFMSYVLGFLPVGNVLYDNACGMRRYLKNRILAFQRKMEEVPPQWRRLAALVWVIDRLHFRYHRGCRLVGGPFEEPEANPYHAKYDWLHGINTQANEQVFSTIDRWQRALNACGRTHHALYLFLFSREHNLRTCPARALSSYKKRRARPIQRSPLFLYQRARNALKL